MRNNVCSKWLPKIPAGGISFLFLFFRFQCIVQFLIALPSLEGKCTDVISYMVTRWQYTSPENEAVPEFECRSHKSQEEDERNVLPIWF